MAVILGVVLLVMAVMNGALFYVLRTAAFTTRKQVESCFLKELEHYGDYLSEKEEESGRLRMQKESLEKKIEEMEGVMLSLKTSPFYAPRRLERELFIPTARYIDNEFFDNHKRVNDLMKEMDYREIINKIRKKDAYHGDPGLYGAACSVLSFLNMEMSYELCTMPTEIQSEILQKALQGREKELFERYLAQMREDGEFDVLDFRTFVREVQKEQDPTMYIRTGDEEPGDLYFGGSGEASGLVHQYDGNISEGLKIIYQNRVYDFSIYRLRSVRSRK